MPKVNTPILTVLDENGNEIPIPAIRGPQGPQGEPGTPGEQGKQGEPGQRGEPGKNGADGAPGRDGDAGEIVSVTAQVLNTVPNSPNVNLTVGGTPSKRTLAFIFDGLTGERGEAGPQGVPGNDGAQGPKGDPGEPGKNGADGVQADYVDEQDAATLAAATDYADARRVVIDVIQRGSEVYWTDPVITAREIIDAVNQGKDVKLHFYDTVYGTGDQLYAYETTLDGVPIFRRNVISEDSASRISIGVQYNGEVKFTKSAYTPPIMSAFATCDAPAAAQQLSACVWYVPKTTPKPSDGIGLMVDVKWINGRISGIGYDVTLVWGEPGGTDNVEIVGKSSVSDGLTGEYSIPAEGTVRYQLIEQGGRKRWQYVSGPLIRRQYSTATEAATADKVVPGLGISYLPGMTAFVQIDKGNSAETMRLVPDEGPTLPVYGNGTGAATGPIPAGYILFLVNAGDHWQIINAPPGGAA